MTGQAQQYKDSIRFNQVIYFGILIGLLIFAGIGLGVRSVLSDPLDKPTIQILNYIALFSLLVFIPSGFWLHTQRMKKIPADTELIVKLYHFRTSFIIKLALFEACGFLGTIVMMLGGEIQVLLQLGIVLVVFLLNYPSIYKYKTELGLKEEDIEKLKSDR